jgi:hypothetical protein
VQAVKRDIFISLSLVFVFVICSLIMLGWGHQMNSRVVVIPFMGIWGSAALLWPAFALRGLRRYMRRDE